MVFVVRRFLLDFGDLHFADGNDACMQFGDVVDNVRVDAGLVAFLSEGVVDS